jgi:CheY-like chemotaxis protein
VVEDEANDFMLLKRALWKAGATARVWWAHDAAEALSLLASLHESTAAICMVCDVRLLGLDGFDLLEKVKATKTKCTVKFAFLTGMCDRATERRAQSEGANGFFIKPSDPADLTNIARQLQKLALE